jgi:hypothetical protein
MKVLYRKLRRSAIRHGCGAGISGRRNADCVWNLFSMRHRLVGQLIFAVDSLATFATSGKSPMRSPAPVCTDKSTCGEVCEAGYHM